MITFVGFNNLDPLDGDFVLDLLVLSFQNWNI